VSVLVVGLSHKSAPVSVLERAAVSGDTLDKLLHDVARLPDIAETFVISTCNRVEVYAEVDRFHGGVAGVCELLSRHSGIPVHERCSTCSRSQAVLSRWSSARTRYSARCGRP
jgi:glutamyl-tRNA reductase